MNAGRDTTGTEVNQQLLGANERVHYFLILIVGILAYSNTLHAPFVLDDKSSIVENHVIKSLSGFFTDSAGFHHNPRSSEAQSNLGAAYLDRGDREKALEHLQLAVKLNPNLFSAHYNLGITYRKSGDTDKAIEQLEQALRINPDVAEAHNQMAVACATKEMLDKAIEHFREAVRLAPDKAEYRKNLELALQKK